MSRDWKEQKEPCDIWGKNILGGHSYKGKSLEVCVCLVGLRRLVLPEWRKPGGECLGIRSEKEWGFNRLYSER